MSVYVAIFCSIFTPPPLSLRPLSREPFTFMSYLLCPLLPVPSTVVEDSQIPSARGPPLLPKRRPFPPAIYSVFVLFFFFPLGFFSGGTVPYPCFFFFSFSVGNTRY